MVALVLTNGIALATDQATFDNFVFLGVAAPVCQGARSANSKPIKATSNADRRDGSADKNGQLFWREPLAKEAEKAAAAGDYHKPIMLAYKAKQQGLLGAQQTSEQANAGNPDYIIATN